ncbi:MAG: ferritin family protein [Candidatus Marinimicrobia bacterium]|nr:ferritin family protein [Candidatus Neomarinimicrobiota bacterium]
MGLLTAKEVFEFAIKIEENGEYFYRKVSEKFDDTNIKSLFVDLANQELEHKKVFENMEARLGNIKISESYPGEFFNYIDEYLKEVIFPESVESEIEKVDTLDRALNYAIEVELKSILYYKEIIELISEVDKKLINDIINEERKHFIRLSEAKASRK